MAYATTAGLPPIIGLYSCLLPLLVYTFFSTSKELSLGPITIVSLLTRDALVPFADVQSEEFISLAIMLAMLSGIIQLILGLLRMGFVTNFLSEPLLVF